MDVAGILSLAGRSCFLSSMFEWLSHLLLGWDREDSIIPQNYPAGNSTRIRTHCVQTPCKHTLAYVRLHVPKYVDRRRQGDIGTMLPTFGYVRLRQPTSRRHTSPRCVHSRRHTLVPPLVITANLIYQMGLHPTMFVYIGLLQ
jgi:hypothetical protein